MAWNISVMSRDNQTFKDIAREYGTIYAVYTNGNDYVKSPRLDIRSKRPINMEIYTRRRPKLEFRFLHSRHKSILVENKSRILVGVDRYMSDAHYKRPHYNIQNRMHIRKSNVYAYSRRKSYV